MERKAPDVKAAKKGILELRRKLAAREGKYIRNMNRYMNNGVRREDLWTPYVWPQAYVLPSQTSEGVQTQFNIVKSCVDTLTSRVSESTVRPFFNALNGDYDTDRTCKSLQHHFDFWLDEQHAYPKSVMCFRDACIFDMGVMEVDAEAKSIDRIPPWEYFIDPAEYMHHAVTRVMRWRKHYPLAACMQYTDNAKLKEDYARDPYRQGEYANYYDLINGYRYDFFGSEPVSEPVKLDYEEYSGFYRRPFVEIFYTKPIKGFFSVSLADDLYPIQRQIDELVKRFDDATRNTPLAIILVPKGSGLKASNLQNKVTAYEYVGGENGEVKFLTPTPINPEWLELLNMYMENAYKLAGISQLSANSEKPADIESGKALQTLEDAESNRFNVQLQQFTHFLVDVSRVCIDTFPGPDKILPKKIMRDNVTWGMARQERNKYSIQFAAASILSKDPSTKLQQVQDMANGGLIDKSMVSHFLQVPDLEGVRTIQAASYDASQKIIQDTIEGDTPEYWMTCDLEMLKSEVIKKVNILMSVGDDEKYIKKLIDLLGKVSRAADAAAKQNASPPPPVEHVKDNAYDGEQIKTMAMVSGMVNRGELSPEQAQALIAGGYPKMKPEDIQAMVKPAASPLGAGVGGQPPAAIPAQPPVTGNQMTGATNA